MVNKLLKTLIIGCSLLFSARSNAQLFINGAQFFIESGATVTVQGNITSNTDILGTGKVLMKGSSAQSIDMNNFTIPNLEMDNVSNVNLLSSARIGTNLLFTNGNIILGANNLTMAAAATISNPASNKFIVTDGTGKLVKSGLVGATAYTFPVGNTTLTYNPVSIANTGTQDDIAVRCLTNANTNGLTGTGFTKEVVDASWDISEAVAGGSNLALTATWAASDELPGFNRNKAGISYYITTPAASVGWDLLNSQTSAATGSNPYTYSRSGITTLGAFAVGTRPVLSPLLVSPKIFLQGPYSGAGLMTDNLRTLNKIPTIEPYTGTTSFTQSGSGGGETSLNTIVGSGAPASNDAIVDWVFVQLHDAGTGTVVSTRSGLLQRDGDVVETDGVSPLNMAGNIAGSYYVSVRHRNHLGVRSLNTLALTKTATTAYNFTTAQTQAFPGAVVTNGPMASLTGGLFGMWAGNANDDIVVKMTGLTASNNDYLKLVNTLGSSTNTIPNTYSQQDLNHDGTVKMTGLSASNNDYLKLLNTLGSSISVISQPVF